MAVRKTNMTIGKRGRGIPRFTRNDTWNAPSYRFRQNQASLRYFTHS